MTPKREAFVREYLIDLNASAAARRAGYSAKTANRIGTVLLSNVDVAKAIREAKTARVERTEITADLVLGDILRIGRAAEAAEEFTPALKARELLGKHLGMFTDKVQLTGKDGDPLNLSVTFTAPPAKDEANG